MKHSHRYISLQPAYKYSIYSKTSHLGGGLLPADSRLVPSDSNSSQLFIRTHLLLFFTIGIREGAYCSLLLQRTNHENFLNLYESYILVTFTVDQNRITKHVVHSHTIDDHQAPAAHFSFFFLSTANSLQLHQLPISQHCLVRN